MNRDIRKGTTIPDTIEDLRQKGFVYEEKGRPISRRRRFLDQDGKPLDDKDRPIVKSNGMYTYFMPDICYHYNKMSRGFSLLVDMLGADHFGYLNRMRAALAMKAILTIPWPLASTRSSKSIKMVKKSRCPSGRAKRLPTAISSPMSASTRSVISSRRRAGIPRFSSI
jgi:arginyl-tRNA synthetase